MDIQIQGKVLHVALQGELDHTLAERSRVQIDVAFEKSTCKHIIIDMSDVTFMDSSGIGMIIGRYKKTEMRGGKLVLAGMSTRVAHLVEISGINKIISQTPTVADAEKLIGGAF